MRSTSRYELVYGVLKHAIQGGLLKDGLVLVESPIATLFRTSRATVRNALELLHQDALIGRFDGRGYIVNRGGGSPEPFRAPLSFEVMGLETAIDLSHGVTTADLILQSVERDIIQVLPFGTYRVVEQDLANRHDVSRQVAREVLSRLRDRSLVTKTPQSHWIVGPLTARALGDDYDVRILLEPAALKLSAPRLSDPEINEFRSRITSAQAMPLTGTLEEIEHDLHVRCLRHTGNEKLRAVLSTTTLPSAVNRVFLKTFGPEFDLPSLEEHLLVIDHLGHRSYDAAAASLAAHLGRARKRSLQRLKTLSVISEPDIPDYLTRL